MEHKLGKLAYIAISCLLCISITINSLFFENIIFGSVTAAFYLVFLSFIVGSIFIAEKGWRILFGFLFLFTLIALISGISLYLYQFTVYVFILFAILLPAILFIPYYLYSTEEKRSVFKLIKDFFTKLKPRTKPWLIGFITVPAYFLLFSLCVYFLIQARTDISLQSPWQVISPYFIPFYFFASIILIIQILTSKKYHISLFLVVLHALLGALIAVIVYKVGYGFDPFIHQAAEQTIKETGTILPKTPYYLGQYGLVLFLHWLSFIDISYIDLLLVPVIFSLLVPATIYFVFRNWLKDKYALLLSLLTLVIPYGSFIMTAPQNLANIFFIETILLSMLYFRKKISIFALYLIAFGTAVIHPLAGLPLLVTVFLFNLFKTFYLSYKHSVILYVATASVFILTLPITFIAEGSGIDASRPNLSAGFAAIFGWSNKYHLNLDIVYFIKLNSIFLAALIVCLGVYYLHKNKLLRNNMAYFTAAAVIAINWFIVKFFITFPSLAGNDQISFTERLLHLTLYPLLPFFLLGIYVLVKKSWEKDTFSRVVFIVVFAGVLSVSLYLSYPRLNEYEPAKFFSMSASDIRTVQFIEQRAHPEHIVLANQMVGAAAISEYGFKKYFDDEFYYSMPSGKQDSFYQYYLEMANNGALRETVQNLMEQKNVQEIYFVVNSYWRGSENIVQQAKKSADEVFIIDAGKLYIFRYARR